MDDNNNFSDKHSEAKLILEARIFRANEKISIQTLHDQLPRMTKKEIRSLIHELIEDYKQNDGAFRLRFVDQSHVIFAVKDTLLKDPLIESYTAGKDLTPGELKTLAFICYFQPVEKQEIHDLVGRGSKKALQTLKRRNFIQTSQESYEILNEDMEPEMHSVLIYSTTPQLADYLGVKNDPDAIKNHISNFM